MGKRSKAKREAIRIKASNGQATLRELDMLSRMEAEAKGRDGYTGEARGSGYSSGVQGGSYGFQGQGSSGYQFHTSPNKEDGVFKCEDSGEMTKECPIATIPSILIDARIWDCFHKVCEEVDTEWIALLLGKLDKDSKGRPAYIIDKFYFPPQTAGPTFVEVPTGVKPKVGVIGALHSHVNMGVFFSVTDTSHSNWPVEIVINRKREYKAIARHKLKCGEFAKNDAKVYLTGSLLSSALQREIDNAFAKGKQLEEDNRKGKGGYPPGLDKEDQGEDYTVPSYPSYVAQPKLCPVTSCVLDEGHNSWHKDYSNNYFQGVLCPTLNCVRETGHPGWHKDKDSCYWNTDSSGRVTVSSSSQSPSKDVGKGDSSQPNLPFASGGDSSTPSTPVIESGELTEQEDDIEELSSDCYCEACEGTGTILTLINQVEEVVECKVCGGDGLTIKGREVKSDEAWKRWGSGELLC